MAPVVLPAPAAGTVHAPFDALSEQPLSSDECGRRFASFAVGCLNSPNATKAGAKLGIMGSADEEEFMAVLQHLEFCTQQRVGRMPKREDYALESGGNSSPKAVAEAPEAPGCSPLFLQVLCAACGFPSGSPSAVFSHLPRDGSGRADLMGLFGLRSAAPPSEEGGAGDLAIFQEYKEDPAGFPAVGLETRYEAETRLLAKEASEAGWTEELVAINQLRSAVASSVVEPSADSAAVFPSADLLLAISKRSGSRRPALGKSALHLCIELAQYAPALTSEAEALSAVWVSSAPAAIAGCFSALRGTKVMARLAETALSAVVRRYSQATTPPQACAQLASAVAAEAALAAPLPAIVSAGLRTLYDLAPKLAPQVPPNEEAEAEAALAAAAAANLCELVLKTRKLASVYNEARALSRAVRESRGPSSSPQRRSVSAASRSAPSHKAKAKANFHAALPTAVRPNDRRLG